MQKQFRFLAVSLLTASLSLPVAAQETEVSLGETVVATVNGQDITLGHMIAARATLDERYDNVPAKELYDGILQQLVQQTALSQKLVELQPLVKLTLENEERSLKAAQVIERSLTDAVSDSDIQTAYDTQFGGLDPNEEYNASHILVATQEEAIALKELLEGGANFAATAREHSTGPSGPNGGELGWFGTGMMVPSFEAATIALEVGEVSAPVETQFGWHLITLNDTRMEEIPTLGEVREQLVRELRTEAVTGIIASATDGVDVVIPELDNITPDLISQRSILEE